jgi:hypothetical protein
MKMGAPNLPKLKPDTWTRSRPGITEDPSRRWTLYAHHRERMTDAVLASAGRVGARLCILGAGECNDVDLGRLSEAFSEIHLVDIDPGALARGVARQTTSVRARLYPHAGVDLSGMHKRLARWRRHPPSSAQIDAVARATSQLVLSRLRGPFDVVVSACVLTQMAFALRDALGDDHDSLWPARLSLVGTHLHTLISLTAFGGVSLFVSDMVSSDLFPLEEVAPGASLRPVMNRVVESGAAYHTANPVLIRALLEGDSFCKRLRGSELLEPWLWTGPLDRTYLVYGFRLDRADEYLEHSSSRGDR